MVLISCQLPPQLDKGLQWAVQAYPPLRQFVVSHLIHPLTVLLTRFPDKAVIEDYLRASGVPFAVLLTGWFAENLWK
jgi:hypothetical protein